MELRQEQKKILHSGMIKVMGKRNKMYKIMIGIDKR